MDLGKAKGVMPQKCFIVSYLLVYRNKVAINPRFLESESCMPRVESESYRAGLGSEVQQVLSPSPGVCGSSPNPSPKERKFPSYSTRHLTQ